MCNERMSLAKPVMQANEGVDAQKNDTDRAQRVWKGDGSERGRKRVGGRRRRKSRGGEKTEGEKMRRGQREVPQMDE